jgi:spermidine/putrescine transport system permease protein
MKVLFDFINGYQNSACSDIYTFIDLVYLYLPFIIILIYNILKDMPKNLIYASKDLGR